MVDKGDPAAADQGSSKKGSAALPTAAQVIAYLRRHPDFLLRHPELLDLQQAPARHQGPAVVDLQQAMVEKLRRDVARLRAVDRIMGKTHDILLRDDVDGDPEIFGGCSDLVRSDALLRLSISPAAPHGLIAFGTRHPGYFHAGQATELLSFLGKIIEYGIRTWLDLPRP
jgi:uncharacterized protein YigA (DUF484 family)